MTSCPICVFLWLVLIFCLVVMELKIDHLETQAERLTEQLMECRYGR